PVVDVAHADRFGVNFLTHVSVLVLWREQDRQVAGSLADPGGATHRARPEPLDRRTLVGVYRLDVQVLADELVIVLGVGDRGLEQLAPIPRDRARRESEDSSRLLHGLAADVVADQPGLTRGRAHVLGLRADHRRRQAGVAARAAARCRCARRLGGGGLGLFPGLGLDGLVGHGLVSLGLLARGLSLSLVLGLELWIGRWLLGHRLGGLAPAA